MKRGIAVMVMAVFALVAMAFITHTAAQAAEIKIGYVDPIKVVNEYNKTKDSEKSFEVKRKEKEAERKRMVDEITKMKDEMALLSDKAKGEKQALVDTKVKALSEFDRTTRTQLVDEGNELLGGIQKDIEKVVTDYAKEAGYDMVLNSRMLLYSKEGYDFTDEIIKRLNKAGK